MMSNLMRALAVFSVLAFLSGCANIISAGREEPIQETPGSRTIGTVVDDEVIETKAKVNLLEAKEELPGTRVAVTSYNGIVLLTGQASSDATRNRAEQIVSQVSKVRRIYNEVSVAGTSSTLSTANDAWLTTKVKTQLLVDESAEGHRVKVVTESGTVYLMGLLTTAEADKVVDVVRQIGGVERIVKMFEYVERP